MTEQERMQADEEFFAHIRAIIDAGRMRQSAAHVQHGTTSTLLHCIAVAYEADRLARRLGFAPAALRETRRAALLHDYYLYDWHVRATARKNHAFRHPSYALENARADYADLTSREANAIRCHMFPLVPVPPRHRIGWVVTLADKRCAAYETTVRRGDAYPELRRKCATYLPDIALSLSANPASPATAGGSEEPYPC